METLFAADNELSIGFLAHLFDILHARELAAMSLCCRYYRDAILSRFKSCRLDEIIQRELEEHTISFYILAGRLTVPLEEQLPRWNSLLMCTHEKPVCLASFFCCLVGSRAVNNADYMIPKLKQCKDVGYPQIFVGCGDDGDLKVVDAWKPPNRIAVVSQSVLEKNGVISFHLTDNYFISDNHEKDDIRVHMRNKCIFYMYRSEFLLH